MTKRNTLTFLINGEDSKILSKGRMEKIFTTKKIYVKGEMINKRTSLFIRNLRVKVKGRGRDALAPPVF